MKIVFDNQIFYLQRYGGISRYFRELARSLARKDDFEISIVAPFHINEYLRADTGATTIGPYFGYEFRRAQWLREKGRSLMASRLYRWHGDADFIHETYFSEVPMGQARSRIVTVYDMIYELYPDDFPGGANVTRAKRAAVARSDHVICISESTRRDLIRLFDVPAEKTSVVHLGYDLVRGDGMAPRRQNVHLRPFILYVGNRGLYKNFASLMRAYAASRALLDACDVVAFGGGPFSAAERALFEELRVADRVRQVAGDDSKLESYYRQALVFAFPSLYEGFGIPPLEAMSFGCAVACSSTSSIPEVVGEAAAFFDPASVDSIRETLEQVVSSPGLRSELIERGNERLKGFSWDRCADETARIYERVKEAAQ